MQVHIKTSFLLRNKYHFISEKLKPIKIKLNSDRYVPLLDAVLSVEQFSSNPANLKTYMQTLFETKS